MFVDPRSLIALVLAVASWAQPQPQYSRGLIVVYGNNQLVQANADWHGYQLRDTRGCGFSAISPAMLGQLAYISTDGRHWFGPCVSVDAVGRLDAYGSIFQRHEIAEVSRDLAAKLGFKYGGQGMIWFGACPPPMGALPTVYRPPLVFDAGPLDWTPNFFPYPAQQQVIKCHERQE